MRKTNKILPALLCLLLAALFLSACYGGAIPENNATQPAAQDTAQTETQTETQTRGQVAGAAQANAAGESYEVVNETYLSLPEVYVSPSDSDDWGENLAGSEGLAHEDWIYYNTDADTVDIYFLDEQNKEHEIYGAYLEPGSTIRLSYGQVGYGVLVSYADGTGSHYPEESTAAGDLGIADAGNVSVAFEIHNSAGHGDPLLVIYATPSGSAGGVDVLGDEILDDGSWTVGSVDYGAGNYDFEVTDNPGATWYFESIYLESDCAMHFFRGQQHDLYMEIHYADGSNRTYYASGMTA